MRTQIKRTKNTIFEMVTDAPEPITATSPPDADGQLSLPFENTDDDEERTATVTYMRTNAAEWESPTLRDTLEDALEYRIATFDEACAASRTDDYKVARNWYTPYLPLHDLPGWAKTGNVEYAESLHVEDCTLLGGYAQKPTNYADYCPDPNYPLDDALVPLRRNPYSLTPMHAWGATDPDGFYDIRSGALVWKPGFRDEEFVVREQSAPPGPEALKGFLPEATSEKLDRLLTGEKPEPVVHRPPESHVGGEAARAYHEARTPMGEAFQAVSEAIQAAEAKTRAEGFDVEPALLNSDRPQDVEKYSPVVEGWLFDLESKLYDTHASETERIAAYKLYVAKLKKDIQELSATLDRVQREAEGGPSAAARLRRTEGEATVPPPVAVVQKLREEAAAAASNARDAGECVRQLEQELQKTQQKVETMTAAARELKAKYTEERAISQILDEEVASLTKELADLDDLYRAGVACWEEDVQAVEADWEDDAEALRAEARRDILVVALAALAGGMALGWLFSNER